MEEQKLKEFFKGTFNTIAEGYDNSAMRFFPESAARIGSFLKLTGSEQILDIATGTGIVALTLAGDVAEGHITGIDFSDGMLSQARRKQEALGIKNVTFKEMDMQALAFPDNYFDHAICGFSLFFVEDMKMQLQRISEKIKSGGQILITTFEDNSFNPQVTLFFDRLRKFNIDPPTITWKRVASTDQCKALFGEADLSNIISEEVECGYYLRDASDWWHIVWNGGFRGLVSQLAPEELPQFKEEHLAEVEELASDKGIRLNMGIIYTLGTVGAHK